MEENMEKSEQFPEEVRDVYVPRPAWQVWAARIGVVLCVLFLIYQFLVLAGGGR